MAKLLVQETAGVREFELVDAETHIGRELDNALRLSDPSISRHHAMIRRTAEGYEVQDLQSSNGVLVNGNRVQSMAIQDGDRVTLGQVQITFVDPMPDAISSPLGTVRMNPADMAKYQAGIATAQAQPSAPAEPAAPPVTPPSPAVAAPLPPAAPLAMAAPPPPAAPPAVAAPPPPAVPPAMAAPPVVARAAAPIPGLSQPPAFLAAWLPPVPDNANPTGERGDFLTRLLAHLIDAAIPVVVWIFFTVLQVVLLRSMMLVFMGCILGLLQFVIMVGYGLVFLPWCWIQFGASPGKKIMKLRVVPEGNLNGRIDVGTAALRLVGHLVNGLLFGLPYLIILGAERKGLQDIISKSLVIKVDR
jgi:uncharacterized RDD family membrane protein YckC